MRHDHGGMSREQLAPVPDRERFESRVEHTRHPVVTRPISPQPPSLIDYSTARHFTALHTYNATAVVSKCTHAQRSIAEALLEDAVHEAGVEASYVINVKRRRP